MAWIASSCHIKKKELFPDNREETEYERRVREPKSMLYLTLWLENDT